MVQPGRQLGLPPKALDDLRVLRQRRVQHLERHLALEMQIPHAVHPAEPALAQQGEQLVVVAQGTPQPGFPASAILGARQRSLRHGHGAGLEGARVDREVLEHLRRGEVAVLGGELERPQDDPLDRPGAGRPELGRPAHLPGSSGGSQSGHREEEQRASGVDVAGRIADRAIPDLGRHEHAAGRAGCRGGTAGRV